MSFLAGNHRILPRKNQRKSPTRLLGIALTGLTSFYRRCKFNIMTRTQIQLPDELYRQAKRHAASREISLAEVVRRGLENLLRIYPASEPGESAWRLDPPANTGLVGDPFAREDWRELANLSTAANQLAEPTAALAATRRRKK